MADEKPVRSPGEATAGWISRRDSYRLSAIESQLAKLQKDIKKLQGRKK